MKKRILISLMLGGVFFLQGCASMLAHHHWQEAQEQQALIVQGNGQEVRVGVNLLSVGYLRHNWPMALAAAAVDGITAYGAYTLYDKNFRSSSRGNDSRGTSINVESGRDATIVINNGDGNTFAAPGDTTTSF